LRYFIFQICGKIIDPKNLNDEEDQATNVSLSLSDEKCSTLKSEHGMEDPVLHFYSTKEFN